MSKKAIQPFTKAVVDGSCRLTRTALIFDKDVEWPIWEDMGNHFRNAAGSYLWWIGDWLNYGEKKYGSKYTSILANTDYDYQTLQDAKWLSGKIEISRRRENLSWSHHQEVAALNPKEQDEWLAKAEAEGWSMRELRSAIRAMRNEASPKEETSLLEKAKNAARKLGKEDKALFLKWVQDEYADAE